MTNGGVQGPIEEYNSFSDNVNISSSINSNTYGMGEENFSGYGYSGVGGGSSSSSNTNSNNIGISSSGGGDPFSQPYFDPMTPKNVTALSGKSAYLSCRVRNLGNKTVNTYNKRSGRKMNVSICVNEYISASGAIIANF